MKLIEDVTESPAEALAICYIEEGMEYVQEDHRGKVLNPNKKREEIFKAKFPGDEFLNFFAFFLRESEKRKLAIMGIQSARMTVMNKELLKQLSEIPNGSSGQNYFIESQMNFENRLMKLLKNLTSKHYSG